MNARCRAGLRPLLWLTAVACLLSGLPVAVAGGGPENVLLVVNRNSPGSLTIANHYVRLRQIPPGNVLTLPWDSNVETIDIDSFRRQLLAPVLAAVERRRLVPQIDYIVYSSDFPWEIDISSDLAKFMAPGSPLDESTLGRPPWQFQPPGGTAGARGSLTGLTYLYQPVMAEQSHYVALSSNAYMRRPIPPQEGAPTLGFRSIVGFGSSGELMQSGGRHYLLSVMLGVTSGRGNSLEEVLNCLRRSAAADGTHPKGTIYYVRNDNVRSQSRHDGFPAAVAELKALGVAVEILEGTVPLNKHDVRGVTIGTASFNWKASQSTILPGAICDNFTSFGGIMRAGAGQTPLSEFIRYGAAGACGTVVEPYSIPHKFPSPMIHVHYARGCSLAEAFYQSVLAPYQQLIVGDPLCQPWADIPQVSVEGLQGGTTARGRLSLKPSARIPDGSQVAHFELFVDGWLRAACRPGETLQIDTTLLADGYHELRVVAVQAGPIQSRGRWASWISTANYGREITASVAPSGTVGTDTPLVVTARCPGSTSIAVLHNSRLLGEIEGEGGWLQVDPTKLGNGPVQLRVVGLAEGGSTSYAWAQPLELTIAGGP
jgi:hypothetical protein